MINKLSLWCLDNNLAASAFVIDNNSLKRFQIENILLNLSDSYQRKFFAEQAEALNSLNSIRIDQVCYNTTLPTH